MSGFVLTEYQGACRAAGRQAQLVEHMYERLLRHEGLPQVAEYYRAGERHRELERFRGLLKKRLDHDNLLPSEPDPEKEELLEIFTGIKESLGGLGGLGGSGGMSGGGQAAVTERLITEEYGLLRLGERMQEHSPSAEIEEALARTRAAIARLERMENAGPAG